MRYEYIQSGDRFSVVDPSADSGRREFLRLDIDDYSSHQAHLYGYSVDLSDGVMEYFADHQEVKKL